ncbi:hypothetical protein [Pseudanabaena sp. PCC 6802]|uniref:hypothetical protein n=1 Tax=Pseudanabaena sp. PCC 6802 TaxID=118173 RepID=UPI0008FBF823|nr:hypothetical protein [Pseudanabaena sp. PCC 6802]
MLCPLSYIPIDPGKNHFDFFFVTLTFAGSINRPTIFLLCHLMCNPLFENSIPYFFQRREVSKRHNIPNPIQLAIVVICINSHDIVSLLGFYHWFGLGRSHCQTKKARIGMNIKLASIPPLSKLTISVAPTGFAIGNALDDLDMSLHIVPKMIDNVLTDGSAAIEPLTEIPINIIPRLAHLGQQQAAQRAKMVGEPLSLIPYFNQIRTEQSVIRCFLGELIEHLLSAFDAFRSDSHAASRSLNNDLI